MNKPWSSRLSQEEKDNIAAAETKIKTNSEGKGRVRKHARVEHPAALKARNKLLINYCELAASQPIKSGDLYVKMHNNHWVATAVCTVEAENKMLEVEVTVDPLTCDLVSVTKVVTSHYSNSKVSGHLARIRINQEDSIHIEQSTSSNIHDD